MGKRVLHSKCQKRAKQGLPPPSCSSTSVSVLPPPPAAPLMAALATRHGKSGKENQTGPRRNFHTPNHYKAGHEH